MSPPMETNLKILVFIVAGAALIPLVARRLRIPSAALEILYGIFLFNVLWGSKPEWFLLLKEVGFIYLMFIAGTELDLSEVIGEKRALWYVFLPLAPMVLSPLVFYQLGYPFYLGIATSMLSAGIIIPVLKESRLSRSDFGRDAIGIALIGELICIALLTALEIGVHYGFTFDAFLQGMKLILLLLSAAVVLKMIYVISWWHPHWIKKIMESEDPVEEGIRAIVAASVIGAFTAMVSGVEAILGSFMAGMIFSQVFKSKGRFEEKINALGFGFLTPFFFIGLGAQFRLELLYSPEILRLALLLTLMVWIGKSLPILLHRPMKLNLHEGLGLSLILSAPLTMIAVSGTIGLRMGLIDDAQQGALILTALVTSILYPLLFKLMGHQLKSSSV